MDREEIDRLWLMKGDKIEYSIHHSGSSLGYYRGTENDGILVGRYGEWFGKVDDGTWIGYHQITELYVLRSESWGQEDYRIKCRRWKASHQATGWTREVNE